MSESGSEPSANPHIPFLFYDVIGRMMPGAYLVVGAVLCFGPFDLQSLRCFLKETEVLKMSGGLAAAVLGTAVLLFGFISSFFGFIIAAISHTVIERWLWDSRPFTKSGLIEFLGLQSASELDARFQKQFGSALDGEHLRESSFLCAYFVWKVNTALGEMQGRQDADLLAAQSFFFVSLFLIVIAALEAFRQCFPAYFLYLLPLLLFASIGSGLTFNYHRKKRVYGRFSLFLAVSEPLPKSDTG